MFDIFIMDMGGNADNVQTLTERFPHAKVVRYYELLAHTKTGKYEPELKIRDYHNGAPLNEIQLGWNNYITWPPIEKLKYVLGT